MPDVPDELEAFDISKVEGATAVWPKPTKEPRLDVEHPPEIPDRTEGPFKLPDEEMGYEGER